MGSWGVALIDQHAKSAVLLILLSGALVLILPIIDILSSRAKRYPLGRSKAGARVAGLAL